MARVISTGAIRTTTRYAIVAGGCMVLHNAIMIGGDHAGLTLWQAALTSFCVLAVIGYLVLRAFVFHGALSWMGFLRYTGAMAANFPLSTGLIWVFVSALHQPMAVAAPASTVVMVLVNYAASHWAIASGRTPTSLRS